MRTRDENGKWVDPGDELLKSVGVDLTPKSVSDHSQVNSGAGVGNEIKVEFECHKCVEKQNFKGTLEELLFNLRDSGFPICPECEDDMEVTMIRSRSTGDETKWKHLER